MLMIDIATLIVHDEKWLMMVNRAIHVLQSMDLDAVEKAVVPRPETVGFVASVLDTACAFC